MDETKVSIGCPDPFSVAELIAGKKIDWSKKSDEIDALAEIFGVTKEAFLNNSTTLLCPFISTNSKGALVKISEAEAEKRLEEFLKANARPQKAVKASSSKKTLTPTQKRKEVINVLLHREVTEKKLAKEIKAKRIVLNTSNDSVYLPTGMQWEDKGYFFNEVAHWYDINQGAIGDCYFLAALCSTVYVNSFWIKNNVALRCKNGVQEDTPWHAIDFYVPEGTRYESSTIWTNKRGTVQTVVVSEELLVNEVNNRKFGVCGPKEKIDGYVNGPKSTLDACWPAVYEKAYAKFLEKCTSDYPNMNNKINGGNAGGALREILRTEKVVEQSLDNLSVDQIWEIGLNAHSKPTCVSIHRYWDSNKQAYVSKAGTEAQYKNMGLYIGHVYSFLDVMIKNSKKYVVLRNPHGRNLAALKRNQYVFHENWTYNYGANSANAYRGVNSIYRYVDGNDDPQKSRGTFLMEINEFKRIFEDVYYYNGPALDEGLTTLVP
jgi:hypothetical protein